MTHFDKILFIGPRSRGGMDAVQSAYEEMMPGARFVSTYRGGSKLGKISDFLKGYAKTFWLLATHPSIEILHIHTAAFNSFWRKMKFARLGHLFGKKVILHIHAGRFGEFMDANEAEVRKAMQSCDGIICLSEEWFDYFHKHSLPNLIAIPNPIDYPESLSRQEDSDRIHFLFLGVLETQKGVHDLVEAVKRLPKETLNKTIVHLAGDGSQREILQKNIHDSGLSDHIKLEGWVTGEKKRELLRLSQCYILPSYKEGLPVSILEAMAWEMPVISSNVGGIPSIVRDDENGILFNPGDINALSSGIRRIVDNRSSAETMGKVSRRIASHYTPTNILNTLKRYYASLGTTV